jgi:hypothetical protein
MEVKINREIRDYTEAIFFGLSLRQCICSILACGVAVGLYFGLKVVLGLEAVSWVCMVAAAPFAAVGFVKYNGLPLEQFALAWFRSVILTPRYLTLDCENYYEELMRLPLEEEDKKAKFTRKKERKH